MNKNTSYYLQLVHKYKCGRCKWEGINPDKGPHCPMCGEGVEDLDKDFNAGYWKFYEETPAVTTLCVEGLEAPEEEDIERGQEYGGFLNQKIRSATGGYIVTLTYHAEDGEIRAEEIIYESLEEALTAMVDEVGSTEDIKRVVAKLFPEEKEEGE